jgi:two-component sensor histidine kinase
MARGTVAAFMVTYNPKIFLVAGACAACLLMLPAGAQASIKDSLKVVEWFDRGERAFDSNQDSLSLACYSKGLTINNGASKVLEGLGCMRLVPIFDRLQQSDTACALAKRAKTAFEQAGYTEIEYVASLTKLADCQSDAGNYQEMLKLSQKAVNVSAGNRDTQGLAHAYHSLAMAAYVIADIKKSLAYEQAGIRFARKAGDTAHLIDELASICNTYNIDGQYDKALQAGREALDLYRIRGQNEFTKAFLLDFLADSHHALGRDDSALYYLKRSEVISEKIGHTINLINIASTYADIYLAAKQYPEGLAATERALTMMRETEYYTIMPGIMATKSAILAAMGNYKMALEVYMEADSLNDVLAGEDVKSKMEAQERKFEKQTADQKIAFLHKSNELNNQRVLLLAVVLSLVAVFAVFALIQYRRQKQTNKTISEQQEKLSYLMKEIHHRVKNNLQVISSLINLHQYNTSDEGVNAILTDTKNKISSIALIHQKLYQSDMMEEIDMQGYLEQLSAAITAVFDNPGRQVSVKVDGGAVSLDIDTSVPVGLIMTELLTNSLKHATPDTTDIQITIVISRLKSAYSLVYSDNGPGVPDGKMDGGKTLGMQMIRMMVRQIAGKLHYETNDGACFSVLFQSAEQRRMNA